MVYYAPQKKIPYIKYNGKYYKELDLNQLSKEEVLEILDSYVEDKGPNTSFTHLGYTYATSGTSKLSVSDTTEFENIEGKAFTT